MSKTTKIIAALGVVAGLGVAALPAFTFAEEVTGDVDVIVRVSPAIAMTIEGNNDDGSGHGSAFDVTPVQDPEENPYQAGYYEAAGTSPNIVYVPTADTTVQQGKTYYESNGGYRKVDAFDPSTAASSIIDTHPTPAASITGTSSSFVAMLPNSVVSGAWDDSAATVAQRGFASKIMVYTNNAGGYTLTIADKDTDTSLYKDASNSIPTGVPESGQTTFDLTAGQAAWGYKVNPETTTDTGYSPMVDNEHAATIKTTNRPTSAESGADRQTIVTYGVATAGDQATGVYKDTIVYTATTNV